MAKRRKTEMRSRTQLIEALQAQEELTQLLEANAGEYSNILGDAEQARLPRLRLRLRPCSATRGVPGV